MLLNGCCVYPAVQLFRNQSKENTPGSDLESGSEDLSAYEFRHDCQMYIKIVGIGEESVKFEVF